MMGAVAKINFDDMTDAIPAFLTILVMPLAYSISEGIAIGVVSWTLINLLSGKAKEKKITPADVCSDRAVHPKSTSSCNYKLQHCQ